MTFPPSGTKKIIIAKKGYDPNKPLSTDEKDTEVNRQVTPVYPFVTPPPFNFVVGIKIKMPNFTAQY